MTTPTLSQLGEMTDEELNVRLMKCLGFHELDESYQKRVRESHMLTPDKRSIAGIKYFTTDANAVAEVRKGLKGPQRNTFGLTVLTLVDETDNAGDIMFSVIDSTPRIQTIALILTLTP